MEDRTGRASRRFGLASRFGLTGLLLFSGGPRRCRCWMGPPRAAPHSAMGAGWHSCTWAPTELMEHSILRNRDAWHAAYGAVATIHHAHALASQQFAIGAGRARGVPSEESVPMRGVPPGWFQRVTFYIGCGTNTSSGGGSSSPRLLSTCRWCPA
jgi:hypothetical protein